MASCGRLLHMWLQRYTHLDDVIKWKHFPRYGPFVRGIHWGLDLRPNKWLSKQLRGWWFETQSCPLWRHRNDDLRNKHFEKLLVLVVVIDVKYVDIIFSIKTGSTYHWRHHVYKSNLPVLITWHIPMIFVYAWKRMASVFKLSIDGGSIWETFRIISGLFQFRISTYVSMIFYIQCVMTWGMPFLSMRLWCFSVRVNNCAHMMK